MEFACKACGSPAVVYPDHISDDAPIKCQRCSVTLCTLSEFRVYAEGAAHAGRVFGGEPLEFSTAASVHSTSKR
jgi:hypothetical protein